MATSLPTVTVGRLEAHQGFLITCTACPNYRTIRRDRRTADEIALQHRATHGAHTRKED